jgi:hypothetical protein
MNDATNTFHWLLDHVRERTGWAAQSYHLEPSFLARAKLAVVYDSFAPSFTKYKAQLEKWVRGGGRLLVWDPMARGGSGPLFEGLSFAQNGSLRTGSRIHYLDGGHPLLNALSGSFLEMNQGDTISSSIRASSDEWTELAYTVLHSSASGQFYRGDETFGPRWTSLMDPVRAPVLLVRKLGSGEIVIAQMGRWSTPAQPDIDAVWRRAAESPLAAFAENVVRWARGGVALSASR